MACFSKPLLHSPLSSKKMDSALEKMITEAKKKCDKLLEKQKEKVMEIKKDSLEKQRNVFMGIKTTMINREKEQRDKIKKNEENGLDNTEENGDLTIILEKIAKVQAKIDDASSEISKLSSV